MPDWLSQNAILMTLRAIAAVAAIAWLVAQLRLARGPQPDGQSQTWTVARHASMLTMLAGWGILTIQSGDGVPYRMPTLALFLTAILIGSAQWFHLWLVAWPASRRPSAVAQSRALAALRLNATLTIPLAFFATAPFWSFDLSSAERWKPRDYWILVVALLTTTTIAAIALPTLTARTLKPWPICLTLGIATAWLLTSQFG